MNIVRRLTLRHLKAHKGRAIITILGIIVSVAMITAVLVSGVSFLHFFGELGLYQNGYQQATFYDAEPATAEKLSKDALVERVGRSQHGSMLPQMSFYYPKAPGYAKGIGDFYAGDTAFFQQMLTARYEGTPPENETQIAVESSFLKKNNLSLSIGDTLVLSVGSRQLDGDPIRGNYCAGEQFKTVKQVSFTITAILHDNLPTDGYAVMRGLSAAEKGQVCDLSVTLKQQDHTMLSQIQELSERYRLEEYSKNKDFLEGRLALAKDSYVVQALLPMSMILLLIIIIAGVVLIFNAFAMSLSERVRWLGMLASVGATKRQKRNSVYFEAFLLGLIGIPLGVLSGIGGIAVTLRLIGERISQTDMIVGAAESGIMLEAIVPFWTVAAVVLLSALTIFISAWRPARKASRIMPIDAIRQTGEIRLKAGRLKSRGVVRRLFGYEGEIAGKNFKRNGRKGRVIQVSVALSVILFLSVNYFCGLFSQATELESECPYQLILTVPYEQREQIKSDLQNVRMERMYGVSNFSFPVSQTENASLAAPENLKPGRKNMFESTVKWFVNLVEDEDFKVLCAENGIDPAPYFSDSVRALLVNNISRKAGDEVFNENILGKKLSFQDGFTGMGMEGEDQCRDIEIYGMIPFDADNYLCTLTAQNRVASFVPQSTFYKCNPSLKEKIYFYGIVTDRHKDTADGIYSVLEEKNYQNCYVSDLMAQLESVNTASFIIKVLMYGFITLITLVTVFNIINTVSTGIAMRKKEFAMLRSVGVTPGGMNKMICLESLYYGFGALLFGMGISILISYWMHAALQADVIAFTISLPMYLGTGAFVLLIIGATMFYAVRAVNRDSIADTLKLEIS